MQGSDGFRIRVGGSLCSVVKDSESYVFAADFADGPPARYRVDFQDARGPIGTLENIDPGDLGADGPADS